MTTRSAFTSKTDVAQAARDLADQLRGADPRGIVFFCSHEFDGAALSNVLANAFPEAEIVGCTTAGEFVEHQNGTGGAVAIALSMQSVNACYGALALLDHGVEQSITAAARQLEGRAGVDLRRADPSRYVGIVLIDGLHMQEEEVNRVLGNLAPRLAFVGGSAGDDLEFKQTRVFYNGKCSEHGAVLLLLDMRVPFTIVKTCSFEPTDSEFTVTRADSANRVIYELNGEPVLEAYAKAIGIGPEQINSTVFMSHPIGMMIGDDPWIRSPREALPDGGLKFYCQIVEGSQVHLMRSTDLVGQTVAAIRSAREALGRPVAGAIVFNCILRRLELDAKLAHKDFLKAFGDIPTAGFHTYGESYLGHINQTCTALLFG